MREDFADMTPARWIFLILGGIPVLLVLLLFVGALVITMTADIPFGEKVKYNYQTPDW